MDSNIHEKKLNILVVTENFPSVNQTWVDTYLENLLVNFFNVKIYTKNIAPKSYSNKVDDLKLLSFVIDLKLCSNRSLSFFKMLFMSPLATIGDMKRPFKISLQLEKKYKLKVLRSFIKSLFFASEKQELECVDIIHSHGEILAFEFMFYALLYKKPLVYTFHGLPPKGVSPLSIIKRRALYGEVARVFVNTEFAKQQAMSVGCPEKKIIILPQGLPLKDFSFLPLPCPNKNELLNILTIGRFHPDKGYVYALLSAARLKMIGVNFHYHIVGAGPQKTRMSRFVRKLNISDLVTIHEPMQIEKLSTLYENAHLFILPSVSNRHGGPIETQGVVLQEAQATGCIPIATRVGGIPECINDKIDGLLIKERSHRAIVDAITYLLERSELWAKYQLAGRRNVEENFSAAVIGKRMAEILRGVMNE